MSMALEICRIAEARVGTDALGRVVTVGLDVGDDAGVEPDNLAFCLESLLARPVITRVPGDALRLTYLEVDDGRPDD